MITLFNLSKTWMGSFGLVLYLWAISLSPIYANHLFKDYVGHAPIYAPSVGKDVTAYKTRLVKQGLHRLVDFKRAFFSGFSSTTSTTSILTLQAEMIVTPSILVCNKPITVTATIENTGTSTFVGDILAELYTLQGDYVSGINGYRFSSGIAANSSVVLKFETTGIGFAQGEYQIVISSRQTGSTFYELVEEYVYQNPKLVSATCIVNENCKAPVGLIGTPSYTNVFLDWAPVPGATGYQTRVRAVGNTNWTEGDVVSGTGSWWYNMLPCTDYEFQVRAICGGSSSNFSSSIKITTQGCNDVYCYSSGDYQANWIQKVQLNTIVNESGIDLGYANFTNLSTTLERGRTYNMVLIPGKGGNSTTMFWRVWIDLNQDNDFEDAGEQVIQRSVGNLATVTAAFTLNNGLPGLTRMRVSMASDKFVGPCETNGAGEVEDYTVKIAGSGLTLSAEPSQLDFSEFEESAVVNVKSNTTWTASENLSWLNLKAAQGIGNGSFDVEVTENITGLAREGVINLVANDGSISTRILVFQRPTSIICNTPLGLNVTNVEYAFARLEWQEVADATGYQTRIRRLNRTEWTEGQIFGSGVILWGNLTPCTEYEAQVRTICATGISDYSRSVFFTTNGCNENTYCYSYGVSWDDWIARVQLNTIDNSTASNFGYGNFTNLSTNLRKGQTTTLTLTPGKDGADKTVYWTAWIDYNQDGDFLDGNEQIVQITTSNTSVVTKNFLIPNSSTNGRTRMRVSMSLDDFSSACETGNAREVEDYTVFIEGGSTANLTLNPSSLNFTEEGGAKQIAITTSIPWSVTKSAADTWIRRISPSTGINNGIIEVEVEPNPTTNTRVATLTIGGAGLFKTATITQTGKAITPILVATPQQLNFAETGGSQTVTITSNIAWRVVGLPDWLTASPTSATGNGEILLTAAANPTFVPRTASVEIRGTNTSVFVNITQAPSIPLGCSAPTGLEAASVGYAYIVLFWNEVQGATSYQTRYRINGGNWELGSIYEGPFISWGNRTPCTVYEYQVRAYCGDNQVSDFSPSIFVTTEGCNDTHCYSYGLAWNDWIQRVQFNTLDNNSDFDFGYANFTDLSATILRKGQRYPLTLTPGKDEGAKLVYWRAWIDYNQNGDFSDPGELIFEQIGSNEESVTANITIGQNAKEGIARMRVTMSLDDFSSPCATGNFREVEDYSVLIQANNLLTVTPTSFNVDAEQNNKTLEIITSNIWIASTDSPWIKLSNTNGSGNQVLGVTIEANNSINVRNGSILVTTNNTSISIPVRQDNAAPVLTVLPDSLKLSSVSSERVVTVTANLDWQVTESATWLTLEPNAGSGNGNFIIRVDANEGEARNTTIEVSGGNITRQIVVSQDRSVSTGGNNWNIEPGGYNVGADAGCVIFKLTSIFPWQTQCIRGCDWIRINPTSGNKGLNVEVCYNQNLASTSRNAAISFSANRGNPSSTVYIEQAGKTAVAGLAQPTNGLLGDFTLLVAPNPANGIVQAKVSMPVAQTVQFRITDMSGKTIRQHIEKLEAGNQSIMFEGLNNGIYLLQGTLTDGSIARSLFVVQQ